MQHLGRPSGKHSSRTGIYWMCQGPSIVYQSEFCPSLLGTHHDWSPFFGWISTWSSTNFHSLSWIPVRSKTPSSSYRGMVANAKTVPQKKRWITKKESEGLTKGGTTLPEFYPLNLDMPPAYGDQIFKSLYSRALHGQISHRPVDWSPHIHHVAGIPCRDKNTGDPK